MPFALGSPDRTAAGASRPTGRPVGPDLLLLASSPERAPFLVRRRPARRHVSASRGPVSGPPASGVPPSVRRAPSGPATGIPASGVPAPGPPAPGATTSGGRVSEVMRRGTWSFTLAPRRAIRRSMPNSPRWPGLVPAAGTPGPVPAPRAAAGPPAVVSPDSAGSFLAVPFSAVRSSASTAFGPVDWSVDWSVTRCHPPFLPSRWVALPIRRNWLAGRARAWRWRPSGRPRAGATRRGRPADGPEPANPGCRSGRAS